MPHPLSTTRKVNVQPWHIHLTEREPTEPLRAQRSSAGPKRDCSSPASGRDPPMFAEMVGSSKRRTLRPRFDHRHRLIDLDQKSRRRSEERTCTDYQTKGILPQVLLF